MRSDSKREHEEYGDEQEENKLDDHVLNHLDHKTYAFDKPVDGETAHIPENNVDAENDTRRHKTALAECVRYET